MSSLEQVKEFWDKRPCNIRHSNAPVGTKQYFDEVEKRKYFVEPHLFDFADFRSVKGKKVLEIGCGIGTTSINFARSGATKVTAVDLSEKSLEVAKQRAEIFGLTNIEFIQGNAEELSRFLPKEEYDLIFSFGVIHHTPHPEKIVQALYNYLSPTGKLKIMIYNRYSWKSLWILFKYRTFNIAKYSEAQTGCPITHTYTKQTAKQLIESGGFRVKSSLIDHIFPYRIEDYVQYRYVKVWYFRWMPKWLFRLLEKRLGWHLCITAERI